ncbi:alpha/beta fold hydrolase [Streptomyces solisilvae]|uniref:alpha/beta fold hydrolase n=1 Tax=Streptomyces malaysiensis TaxID=92644 RepID=UPI003686984D
MSTPPTPLLFLHGNWHGSWCWTGVIAALAGTGRAAVAVDMAGHGLRARRPAWTTRRPVDEEALATEVSPLADVDLDQAGDLLVSQLGQIGRGGPVTVIAHSMGGTVLTRAAQQAPELVARAVYLSAAMPASDIPAIAYLRMPESAGSLVRPCMRADPAAIGALRLDPGSDDAEYRQRLRNAFYGDVDRPLADAALGLLTPDAPAGIAFGTTTLTRDGWGSVPRTYITCARDMAVRPALQRKFIAEADAAFPDEPTAVVALDSSHSPFLSMPGRLADVIAEQG